MGNGLTLGDNSPTSRGLLENTFRRRSRCHFGSFPLTSPSLRRCPPPGWRRRNRQTANRGRGRFDKCRTMLVRPDYDGRPSSTISIPWVYRTTWIQSTGLHRGRCQRGQGVLFGGAAPRNTGNLDGSFSAQRHTDRSDCESPGAIW